MPPAGSARLVAPPAHGQVNFGTPKARLHYWRPRIRNRDRVKNRFVPLARQSIRKERDMPIPTPSYLDVYISSLPELRGFPTERNKYREEYKRIRRQVKEEAYEDWTRQFLQQSIDQAYASKVPESWIESLVQQFLKAKPFSTVLSPNRTSVEGQRLQLEARMAAIERVIGETLSPYKLSAASRLSNGGHKDNATMRSHELDATSAATVQKAIEQASEFARAQVYESTNPVYNESPSENHAYLWDLFSMDHSGSVATRAEALEHLIKAPKLPEIQRVSSFESLGTSKSSASSTLFAPDDH